ncbi:LPXTG cell wall anchor domain-containing protein [Leucobacter insecticola]|uniref:LPXTG cell wall anchor domain-containing protein n=1 Tax=Leucobacter insecticola TaxID=2714934 RepID=A0A6G8FJX4_9MICO|nr:invasin domain 3-containing protein [Leucobacter insecticola]QIM16648.1 LPXTG cell wall anchor domain-containing protein [Leucobacter insecticola]
MTRVYSDAVRRAAGSLLSVSLVLASATVGISAAHAEVESTVATEVSLGSGSTLGGTTLTIPTQQLAFTSMASCGTASLGMTQDGTVYTWGSGAGVGQGDSVFTSLRPAPLAGDHRFKSVSIGPGCGGIGIDVDSKAWVWGANNSNQIGDGTTTARFTPVPLPLPEGVTLASAAITRVGIALSTDGDVYTWGYSNTGALGSGLRVDRRTVPTKVDGLPKIAQIFEAGESHAVFVKDVDGNFWSWGDKSTNGQGVQLDTPQLWADAPDFIQIVGAIGAAAGVTSNGEIYSWGQAVYGELGRPVPSATSEQPGVVQLPAGKRATQIASYVYAFTALAEDGTAYSWGFGDSGRLGTGSTSDQSEPTKVNTSKKFSLIANGNMSPLAVATTGEAYGWGINYYGQMGTGATSTSPILSPAPLGLDQPRVLVGEVEASNVRLLPNGDLSFAVPAQAVSGTYPVTVRGVQVGTFTYGTSPAVVADPVAAMTSGPAERVVLTASGSGDEAPQIVWQSAIAIDDSCVDPSTVWTDIADPAVENTTTATTASDLGRTDSELAITSPTTAGLYCYRAVMVNALGTETETNVVTAPTVVRVVAGAAKAATIATSTDAALADGADPVIVTVSVFDEFDNPLAGEDVELSASLGTVDPLVDNQDGTYTSTLTSVQEGEAVVTFDVTNLEGSASVKFLPVAVAPGPGPTSPVPDTKPATKPAPGEDVVPGAKVSPASAGGLATTGAESMLFIGGFAGLALLGGAMLVLRRRRA